MHSGPSVLLPLGPKIVEALPGPLPSLMCINAVQIKNTYLFI